MASLAGFCWRMGQSCWSDVHVYIHVIWLYFNSDWVWSGLLLSIRFCSFCYSSWCRWHIQVGVSQIPCVLFPSLCGADLEVLWKVISSPPPPPPPHPCTAMSFCLFVCLVGWLVVVVPFFTVSFFFNPYSPNVDFCLQVHFVIFTTHQYLPESYGSHIV